MCFYIKIYVSTEKANNPAGTVCCRANINAEDSTSTVLYEAFRKLKDREGLLSAVEESTIDFHAQLIRP